MENINKKPVKNQFASPATLNVGVVGKNLTGKEERELLEARGDVDSFIKSFLVQSVSGAYVGNEFDNFHRTSDGEEVSLLLVRASSIIDLPAQEWLPEKMQAFMRRKELSHRMPKISSWLRLAEEVNYAWMLRNDIDEILFLSTISVDDSYNNFPCLIRDDEEKVVNVSVEVNTKLPLEFVDASKVMLVFQA